MRLACNFTVEYVEETTPDQAREARRLIVELMLQTMLHGGNDDHQCDFDDDCGGVATGGGTLAAVAGDVQKQAASTN